MGCANCCPREQLSEEREKKQGPRILVNPSKFYFLKTTPLTKDYEIVKVLGQGGYGKVFKVKNKTTGEMRAAKEVPKPRGTQTGTLLHEVEILSNIDHPNVLKLFELYEDVRKYYVVSELLAGGELFDYIVRSGHLTESLAAAVMIQLFSAIKCCHEHNIVHRDLKPENIMLENEPTSASDLHLKLIDFGTSVLSTGDPLKTMIGTAYYIAPEVLAGAYDMKCDIWSLGVILYVLLSGVPPFNGRSDEEISDNIRKGEYSLTSKEWETVSQEAKELVQKLLVLDPAYRISLADAMVDPWITSHKIDRSREIPAASEVLVNLKRFRGDLKLRQALSAYAVSHFSSKEEINRQKEMFKALDKDNSGMLTRSELIEGLSTQMSLSDAESEVTRIMENLDMNHTGSVDYSEFVTSAAFAQNAVTVAQLKNAFQSLDLDHSGKLSCAELKALLGRGVTGAEDWEKLVAQADTDGDGEISLSEFISFLLNEK